MHHVTLGHGLTQGCLLLEARPERPERRNENEKNIST